ncbi:MAG: hypothetical protein KGM47_01485 [Acidobacteriota bacterium]|nr:hypothetical protein [Acidobacteriota bacterium]
MISTRAFAPINNFGDALLHPRSRLQHFEGSYRFFFFAFAFFFAGI